VERHHLRDVVSEADLPLEDVGQSAGESAW